jgi:hypothetical protein
LSSALRLHRLLDWVQLTHYMDHWRVPVNTVMDLQVP